MNKIRQNYGQEGSAATILIIAVLALALIATAAFAFSANSSKQDYKDNLDAKVAAAVGQAQQEQQTKDEAAAAEKAKSPTLTYTGSATYGSISFKYPRTWNGYIDTTSSTDPIKGYFADGIVPAQASAYILRIQLLGQDYNTIINSFSSTIKQGTLSASAYVPPKMAGVKNVQTGTRLDGAIENGSGNNPTQGSMVVIKVRDKTLEVYTEIPTALNDFNNTILASLTFVP